MKKATLFIVLLAIIASVISSCDDSHSSSKQKKSKINGLIAKAAKTIKTECSDYVTAKPVKVGCDSMVMGVTYHIAEGFYSFYVAYPYRVKEFKIIERPDLRSLPRPFIPR